LIYLGVKTWREADVPLAPVVAVTTTGFARRFRTGLLVSLSNPKAMLFCVAFFPQFLQTDAPLVPQLALLLPSFFLIETAWMSVYASGGARLSIWLREGQRMRWFNRSAGGAFVCAGVALGALRR
jgi:threonine/homoserine/homoserine lactone efflux protein